MGVTGINFKIPSIWMITGGIASGAGYFLTQALFLEKAKLLLQTYRFDEPVPLDEKTDQLAHEVLLTAKIPKRFRDPPFGLKKFDFFTLNGFDTFHLGSPILVRGALIGVPKTFFYNSVEDVDTSLLKIRPRGSQPVPIDWQTGEGKKFVESFILSDNAKRFAILREVYAAHGEWTSAKALNIVLASLVAACLGHLFVDRVRPYKSKLLNGCGWSLGLVCGLLQFTAMLHTFQSVLDLSSDKEAIGTDFERYKPAALEYYRNQLQQNQALRSLAPDIYEKKFTAEGNCRGLFSLGRSLTDRIEHIEKLEKQDV